jgi:DNA-nicking Smr family endonuclease
MNVVMSERNIFYNAIEGSVPLKQDRVNLKKRNKKTNTPIKSSIHDNDWKDKKTSFFYFSDEYQPLLHDEQNSAYYRQYRYKKSMELLAQAYYVPEYCLDLHGYTQVETKQALNTFLFAIECKDIFCFRIIHGLGTYTLKRKIPYWLAQHPKVTAFHQAPKKWGGKGALLGLYQKKYE